MPNSFYNHGTYPVTGAPGASAALRSELDAITTGFSLLPTLSGNANKALVVNAGGTAVTVTTGTFALAGKFATTGAFNTTIAQGATTTVTLPLVSGTLATLAGTETLSNKTIAASTLSGTVSGGGNQINNVIIGTSTPLAGTFTTLTGTTLSAITLGGTVSGGGNQINNVIIGTSTPLAGTFTTLTGTTLVATSGTVSTAPTSTTDIANKLYVDTVAQGLDTKASCIAATTANITLSGTQTVDGIVLIATDRVLVKNQTAPAENGLYLCAAGAWTRTTDADTWDELRSAFVFIEKGTVYADTGWTCTIDSGGTLGTTAVTWAQFSGAGSFTAGTGLTLTGTAFSLTAPVTVALGGTNATTAGITSFNNITGFSASGPTGTTSTNLVFSDSPALTGAVSVTSASATSLAVGLTGATNPAFAVDSSTGSQVAGLKITGAVTGGSVAIVATDSGSNASVTLNAKGSGTIGIGSVSTGAVTITPATTITGVATLTAQPILSSLTASKPVFTDASKGLVSTGTLAYDQGGTGQTTYATGDIVYASASNTLAKLAIGTSTQVLTVTAGVPVWAAASTGSVTSVAVSGGTTGLTTSGGPITTSGTITLAGRLAPAIGGTGIANNAASTLTINGAFATTLTVSGATGVTLPTTGTLATLAGSETLTNKTLTSPTLTTPALGTPASGILSACTVDGTDEVGFKNIPQNSQSAAYTLVLADAGKHIFHPSGDANARTYTIPANSSVAYPIGTALTFINMTSQVVTIAITTDTMYLSSAGTTGSRSLAQYGSATAIKMTSTTWLISGSGLT